MPALLTVSQSRWTLHTLVAILSTIAIASSAPHANGVVDIGSGRGDIRGIVVLIGGAGLLGLLVLRLAGFFLPLPWTVYLDRVEFTFSTMLWVLWTSATMAFSAFTVEKGVCATTVSDIRVPACPLLTFDLAVLHLLSTTSLALVLIILTTVLAPDYELSKSTSYTGDLDDDSNKNGRGGLVLWDMALAPIPHHSTAPKHVPAAPLYGSTAGAEGGRPSNTQDVATPSPPRDKFAEGRVSSYVLLLLCSIGVVVCTGVLAGLSDEDGGSAFIIVVGLLSMAFSMVWLLVHWRRGRQAKASPTSSFHDDSDAFFRRNDRALEVGFASILFLLWPLAAVVYTLFPATPNRPCANPSAEEISLNPDFNNGQTGVLCILSCGAITLAWLASWIVLIRVIGLLFPMPDVGWKAITHTKRQALGEEGQSLLSPGRSSSAEYAGRSPSPPPPEVQRPQVKYGRLIAGEAFELGDDDDDRL